MNFVQIWVLFTALIMVKGQMVTIQCYECDDCDVVDDCLLKSCPLETTTTTTLITTSTTVSTTSSTPRPPISSTPPLPTPPAPTPAPAPTTSTATTPVLPSQPTSETATSTTDIIGSTTEETTYPTTPETEAPTHPETEEPSTIESTFSTTMESTTDKPTEEPPNEPTQKTAIEEILQSLELSSKSVQIRPPRYSYHCYSIDRVDNHKWKKKRGCVKVSETENACTVLKVQFGCPNKNCKVCSTDGCNSSCGLRYSTMVLAIATIIGLICK